MTTSLPISTQAVKLLSWLFPEFRAYETVSHETVRYAYEGSLELTCRLSGADPAASFFAIGEFVKTAYATKSIMGYLAQFAFLATKVIDHERYGQSAAAESALLKMIDLVPMLSIDLQNVLEQMPTPRREYVIAQAVQALAEWFFQFTRTRLERDALVDVRQRWMDSRGTHNRVGHERVDSIHTHPMNKWGRVVTVRNDGQLDIAMTDQVNATIYAAIGGINRWPLSEKERVTAMIRSALDSREFGQAGLSVHQGQVFVTARVDAQHSSLSVAVDLIRPWDKTVLYGDLMLLYQRGMSGPKSARFDNRGIVRFQNVSVGIAHTYRLEFDPEG